MNSPTFNIEKMGEQMQFKGNVLANRLTIFILAGTVAFYASIALSLNVIRNQYNSDAAGYTARFVQERLEVLQDQVRQFARDYNNWADVYFAARDGDIEFIAGNYGITAVNGDMFDGAIIFDGPFEVPISWSSGGDREPEPSFMSASELEAVRLQVLKLPLGDRPTFDFVVFESGVVRFASASRILPDISIDSGEHNIESAPIGIIFKTPVSSDFNSIRSSLNLRALEVGSEPKESFEHLLLRGVFEDSGVYASWLPPLPGNRLIREIAPVLAFILAISAVFVTWGTRLLRRSTQALADRELEALQLARRDPLTALPNRLALTEYLSNIEKQRGSEVAVVLLDLDGFKNVNDLVGHGGGDHVVCEVARRFQSLSRTGVFFSRIGGDEFVIVVHGHSDLEWSAQSVAASLLDLISEPIVYQGSRFEISCSCGIAIRKSAAMSPEELMQCADRAMYKAKRLAGNSVVVYDEALDGENALDREIERSLRSSLTMPDDFSLSYQPIVDSQSRVLVRAEALARWFSPQHGNVSPDVFIPVAEKSGLMVSLGDLLLSRVVDDMSRNSELKVSVNVSPLQLMTPGFAQRVRSLFLRGGVDPSRVEFELTEGLAVQNLDAVSGQLQELRSFGFTTALDDFGTGFSSIGYLRHMPFDTLKIDRSFISGLVSRSSVVDFVRPIISLGHSLGKKVTAEGVETDVVADFLSGAGCDSLQGYYFGRPQSIDAILDEFLVKHDEKAGVTA